MLKLHGSAFTAMDALSFISIDAEIPKLDVGELLGTIDRLLGNSENLCPPPLFREIPSCSADSAAKFSDGTFAAFKRDGGKHEPPQRLCW
jgi:hypothetical protein